MSASGAVRRALRGAFLTYTGNPFRTDPAVCHRHESDGLVLIEAGRITHAGPWDPAAVPPGVAVEMHAGLLTAGFVDAHVHYPQLPAIAAPGAQLLDWLTRYIFPAERRYADPAWAAAQARAFLRRSIASGVTTPVTYCTVHPASVDAYFAEAARYDLCTGAGKVLMDRNAPPELCETPTQGYDRSLALARTWHGRGRAFYAVTPRFAVTSSPAALELAGALVAALPGLYMQTHLAENRAELRWVRELFPSARDYLDVYDRYGLVAPRALFGHAVHLSAREWRRLAEAGAAVVHCPSSNLFLGSGLFNLKRAAVAANPVRLALGSDIGAGTSLSPLVNLNEAYKIAQLRGFALGPHRAFYLATLGSARALYLDQEIGAIAPGHAADLVELDPGATPLLAGRTAQAESLEEMLFVLLTLGDERVVRAVTVAGRDVFRRTEAGETWLVQDGTIG